MTLFAAVAFVVYGFKPMGYKSQLGELTIENEDTLRLTGLPEDLTQEQLRIELFDQTLLRITAEHTDYEWFLPSSSFNQGDNICTDKPIPLYSYIQSGGPVIQSVKRVGVDKGGAIWEVKLK